MSGTVSLWQNTSGFIDISDAGRVDIVSGYYIEKYGTGIEGTVVRTPIQNYSWVSNGAIMSVASPDSVAYNTSIYYLTKKQLDDACNSVFTYFSGIRPPIPTSTSGID